MQLQPLERLEVVDQFDRRMFKRRCERTALDDPKRIGFRHCAYGFDRRGDDAVNKGVGKHDRVSQPGLKRLRLPGPVGEA